MSFGPCGSDLGGSRGSGGLLVFLDFVALLGGPGGFDLAAGSGGPSGFRWACGAWWVWYAKFGCFCVCFGYLIRLQSIFNGSRVFGNPKAFDDPQVFDDLKVISNESIDFDDPKEFEDPQVFVYSDKIPPSLMVLFQLTR